MTISFQALSGAVLFFAGAVKTWLHVGSVPILSLPTCNGETIEIALGSSSLLAQAHCWGCYAMLAGAALGLSALYRSLQTRRSVAFGMD